MKKYDAAPEPVDKGQEILRAAIGADDDLYVIIKPLGKTAEEHCGQWGLVLADVAQHVADLCQRMKGMDREDALEMVRTIFNDEIKRPTTTAQGHTTC